MTSHDVRDMLDLPSSSLSAPNRSKKGKSTGPRLSGLKGLQREVQSLGGDNPIALVPAVPLFKKRRAISRKPVAKWELRPFMNSAREDDLQLRHWRRIETDQAAPTEGEEALVDERKKLEDSMFAKFNVHVQMPKYDDEQYNAVLKSQDWSKEETDYLMGLVKDFDLRWPVIWDRYEYKPGPLPQTNGEANAESRALVPAQEVKQRSVEDLKTRYYEVAAKMMAVHRPVQYMSQAEFSLHQMMSSFDPEQERRRKRFAEAAMSRSLEEKKEEEQLLVELKRIMARSDRLNEERKELYNLLESRPSSGNLGPYTTSAGLTQLVQQLANADKSKKKRIMGPEATPQSTAPSQQQDRRESVAQQAPAPTPSTNKKGPAAQAGDRKKLSEEEEAIFGVSHHDRLTSGPQFRHDRVLKLINGRSAVVASRVTNILSELEVPPRLVMPTQDVCKEFESLLTSVFTLLDSKKLGDKLDAEIKVAEAQKAERERKARDARGETEAKTEEGGAAQANGAAETNGEVKNEDTEANGTMAAPQVNGNATPGAQKRSASVLSSVSDKSNKRQKK